MAEAEFRLLTTHDVVPGYWYGVFLVALESNGSTLWSKQIIVEGTGTVTTVAAHPDGSFLVAGEVASGVVIAVSTFRSACAWVAAARPNGGALAQPYRAGDRLSGWPPRSSRGGSARAR